MLVEFQTADGAGGKVHVAAGLIQTVADVPRSPGVAQVVYSSAAGHTGTVNVKGTADEVAARVNGALAAMR